ncbi:hypothetical protein DXG03_007374 [Asterophora parasitica]|uniref:Uncharacterized protein n=1 Tax=Asterophora parasitica TaxID=117018 RepID=A0A9P7K6Z7_9AGAR|nr:hypothetical protein DXG03_007374 [Asterophora parasitica]
MLGRGGLQTVDKHFEQLEYHNDTSAIPDYVSWALRPNGPAIYLHPTPKDYRAKKGDEGYMAPDGIFEATFIIETASPILKLMKNSVGNFGYPYDGLALTAAAVRRAFLYRRVKLQQLNATLEPFSCTHVGDMVQIYATTARALTNRRWDALLGLFGALKAVESVAGSGMMDTIDDELNFDIEYIPSSP